MKLPTAILVGGLIAGALDISYAFIVYGPLSYRLSPVEVLQSVASGWVGNDVALSSAFPLAVAASRGGRITLDPAPVGVLRSLQTR